MADENIADVQRQLTEAMAAVQRDLALFGKVTKQTAEDLKDAEMKAKYGIENFTKSTTKAGESLGALAGAGIEAGKAMLEGKKGAAAFNSSLDELSKAATLAGTALTLLIPGGVLIKGLVAGLTMATTAVLSYTKAANEMSDKLYQGYSKLQESGAAASDGMTGVFEDAKKLGLSMNQLDSMVSQVAANSQELALMSGSVSRGRHQFAEMSNAIKDSREGFYKMGITQEAQNEGMMRYIKNMTLSGRAQTMTTKELADGARAYILEQDKLTKLTGISAQKQQAILDRARENEQFNARIRELELENTAESRKAADGLRKGLIFAAAAGDDAAEGFMASVNQNLRNEKARELNFAAQGRQMQAIDDILRGMDPAKAMAPMFKNMANFEKNVGIPLNKLGAGAGVFLKSQTLANSTLIDQMGIEKAMAKIEADQVAQQKGAGDKLTDAYGRLIDTQTKANDQMERFVMQGTVPATEGMIAVAKASAAAAQALYNLARGGSGGPTEETRQYRERGTGNPGLVNDQGYDFGQLSGAEGGVFRGPKSGYPVLMHGTEAIVPMDKLTDASKLSGIDDLLKSAGKGGALSAVKDTEDMQVDMGNYVKKMLKDTETLTKLTDADVKQTKAFNLLSDRYIKTKKELMEQELDLMEEQKTATAQAIEMGPGGMGGGIGLRMPSAASMPSMGGGQGLQIGSQDDLKKMGLNIKAGDVQAQGAKISPKIIELAKQIQAGVPGFNYFSSFNDKFHQENAPTSKHAEGLAVDFTVAQPPSVEDGKSIVSWLKQMGASVAIDEYNSPTAKATGGHFHAQIPAFEDGGSLGAGRLGIAGEAGPELITGPAGITPMNDLMGAFSSLGSMMKQQVDKLDELVRAQKNSNDIQTKILRVQA